jgi:REP element-mobilizing transposase RayT
VFKANREVIKGGFRSPRRFALIHYLVQRYQRRFWIRIEQISIQGDHIHLLIRTTRRSQYLHFFRVLAGQIAQRFEKEGLLTFNNEKAPTNSKVKTNVISASNVILNKGNGPAAKAVTDTPERQASVGGKSFGARSEMSFRDDSGSSVNAGSSLKFGTGVGLLAGSGVKLKRLWKSRPFTRVVKGWRAYKTVRDYIQLNEKEALGEIPYRSERMKGMSSTDWEVLWS